MEIFKQKTASKDAYEDSLKVAYKMLEKRNLDKAFNILNNLISLFPNRCEAYGLLGVYYDIMGEYQKGIECQDNALKINNNYATAYYYIGRGMIRIGETEKGIENYKTAIKLLPENDFYLQVITILLEQKLDKDAYYFLSEALTLFPKDDNFNYLMAAVIISSGQKIGVELSPKVLDYLDIAAKGNIRSEGINILRCQYYYYTGNIKSAFRYADNILKKKYNERAAQVYSGCLAKLQMYDDIPSFLRRMEKHGSQFANKILDKHSYTIREFEANQSIFR